MNSPNSFIFILLRILKFDILKNLGIRESSQSTIINIFLCTLSVFTMKINVDGQQSYQVPKIYHRDIETTINKILNYSSVIFVEGPMQVGKTFMFKNQFADTNRFRYFDLENEKNIFNNQSENATQDLLVQFNETYILDEVHKEPAIINNIKILAHKQWARFGRYIYTSSIITLNSISSISSLVEQQQNVIMLPPTISELGLVIKNKKDLLELMFKGFYPILHATNLFPNVDVYYHNYITKYITGRYELCDESYIMKILTMLAKHAGDLISLNHINKEILGLETLDMWQHLSMLKQLFVILLLPPFQGLNNTSVPQPRKLYFYDVGLLTHLLDIKNYSSIELHHRFDHLFENMMVIEIVKILHNFGFDSIIEPYFWSTKKANTSYEETVHSKKRDLILLETEAHVNVIEIQNAYKPDRKYHENLNEFSELYPRKRRSIINKFIIYAGTELTQIEDVTYLPPHTVQDILIKVLSFV